MKKHIISIILLLGGICKLQAQTSTSGVVGIGRTSVYSGGSPLGGYILDGYHLELGISHKLKHAPIKFQTGVKLSNNGSSPFHTMGSSEYRNVFVPVTILYSYGVKNTVSVGGGLFMGHNFDQSLDHSQFFELQPFSTGLTLVFEFMRANQYLNYGVRIQSFLEATPTTIDLDNRRNGTTHQHLAMSIVIARPIHRDKK
ncbi:MAG: hypothetical protein JJ975_01975 [Bacteroidia bacterium]|nr:hypothetical protein [Bacteroidia bacterium]